MSTATIQTAMREAVAARVATIPVVDQFPIVWTDEPSYSPDASTPYLRCSLFYNTTRRLFLNGADPHQRLNLLQIDVMAKRSWTGKQATQVAGQIAQHFAADTRMTFGDVICRVTAAPHVAAPLAGDVFMQVPVTVPVECFA
ncbi:MAG: phage tail terminator-like protein [Mesorhizobium sp.]